MSWNWLRVLNRTVSAISEEYYQIELEMAADVGGLYAGGGMTSDGVPYPAPPIVEPTPPQSCIALNGLHYDYTTAGTRTATGLTFNGQFWQSVSTDFMNYGTPGYEYPAGGILTNFSGDSIFGCGGSVGGTDYTCGTSIHFTLIGPGSLQIITATGGPGSYPNATNMSAQAVVSGTTDVVDTDTQPLGTALNVTIAPDAYCAHYVYLTNVEPGSWGFTSATWTPN